jgi:hypothetical protein
MATDFCSMTVSHFRTRRFSVSPALNRSRSILSAALVREPVYCSCYRFHSFCEKVEPDVFVCVGLVVRAHTHENNDGSCSVARTMKSTQNWAKRDGSNYDARTSRATPMKILIQLVFLGWLFCGSFRPR